MSGFNDGATVFNRTTSWRNQQAFKRTPEELLKKLARDKRKAELKKQDMEYDIILKEVLDEGLKKLNDINNLVREKRRMKFTAMRAGSIDGATNQQALKRIPEELLNKIAKDKKKAELQKQDMESEIALKEAIDMALKEADDKTQNEYLQLVGRKRRMKLTAISRPMKPRVLTSEEWKEHNKPSQGRPKFFNFVEKEFDDFRGPTDDEDSDA